MNSNKYESVSLLAGAGRGAVQCVGPFIRRARATFVTELEGTTSRAGSWQFRVSVTVRRFVAWSRESLESLGRHTEAEGGARFALSRSFHEERLPEGRAKSPRADLRGRTSAREPRPSGRTSVEGLPDGVQQ